MIIYSNEKILNEAKLMMELSHPNILQCIETFENNGLFFISFISSDIFAKIYLFDF